MHAVYAVMLGPKGATALEDLPQAEITSPDAKVVVFRDQVVSGQFIKVTAPWSVIGGTWKDCRFVLTTEIVTKAKEGVAFGHAKLEGCSFETSAVLPTGTLSFNDCTIDRCDFRGALKRFLLLKVPKRITGTSFSLYADRFEAEDVGFERCNFGGRIHDWSTSDATFFDSYWAPEIDVSADLTRVRFDGSTIVVGSWSDVCVKKENVYLQTARRIIDDWSELRTEYTGVRLYIILLLTLAFIAPYIGKAWALSVAANLMRSVPVDVTLVPLWHAMLFPTGVRVGPAVLALLLLAYNGGRLWLTFRIAAMREREEHLLDTGFAAARPRFHKTIWKVPLLPRTLIEFAPLLVLHRTLKVLFWLSLISATVRLAWFLLTPVPTFEF